MSKFNENLKDLFTNWNTIPNWLCFFRIACIPVFTTLFIKGMYIPAFIIMIVAALSDVFDGKIARKYNMVSNLGKILDPIADKLSQMANGAVYTDDEDIITFHDKKLDALEDIVESANGKPILVAYWFKHDYTRIV